MAHLRFQTGRSGQHHDIEAPLQGGGHVIDPLVPRVGRGDEGESLAGRNVQMQLRDADALFRQQGDERVLHFAGAAGDLLEAGHGPVFHSPVDRTFEHGAFGRPLGDEQGIIPGIAYLLFRRPGRPLYDPCGIAVDGGAEVFGQPALGRARFPHQQEGPVREQGGDGYLHQPLIAHVFGRDLHIPHPAAADVGAHRPRRHAPAHGHGPGLGVRQRRQLGLKQLLGRKPLHIGMLLHRLLLFT